MLTVRIAVLAASALLIAAAAPKPQVAYWAQEPTEAQKQAAFAAAGVKPDVTGRALASCKVRADGTLEGCRLLVGGAAGGLGQALMALTAHYRLNMAGPSAPAVGGEVIVGESRFPSDTDPTWLKKPTSEDLRAVFPVKAMARGEDGQATINCLVSQQGALFECVTVSEKPAGEHFGDAALALTPQFLMKPALLNGQPVVTTVSIPIKFVTYGGGPVLPGKGMVSASMAWPEAPSYADVAAAYPVRARAAKVGGRATLSCEFNRQGRLTDCETITEAPKHEGFGDAARKLAKDFRAFPNLSDGRNVAGATVQLPFVFDPAMLAGGVPVVGKAQWAGLPTAEETSAAFGKLTATSTVRVRMACTVLQGGGVSDCRVEDETPAGQGVGAAALSLSPRFKLTTWTSEGLPTVGGTINIPLRYEPEKPQAAAPPKG
jgi:TonB family protein